MKQGTGKASSWDKGRVETPAPQRGTRGGVDRSTRRLVIREKGRREVRHRTRTPAGQERVSSGTIRPSR